MATLTITGTEDYSDGNPPLSNITQIVYSAAADAFFSASQFDNVQISKTVQISGDGNGNFFQVINASGTFSAAGWTVTNWTGNDRIEIIGSSGADTITGPAASGGQVLLRGGAGADKLIGGAASNAFLYINSVELVAGEELAGGSLGDVITIPFSGNYDFSSATISSVETLGLGLQSVTATFSGKQIGTGAITDIGAALGHAAMTLIVKGKAVNLSAVSFFNWGGAFDSIHINGTAGNDVLTGSSESDIISGAGGNDVIGGGAGVDGLEGGSGKDTISYFGSNAGVTVYLNSAGSIGTASGGHAQGDIGHDLENIFGSSFSDELGGNNAANVLNGANGSDTLFGFGGKDTLNGGDFLFGASDALYGGGGKDKLLGGLGDDGLEGGAGADVLNGGTGVDGASFGLSGAGITIKLGKNGAKSTGKGGDAQGDTIKSVENLTGSFSHNDKLTGNNLGNVFVGFGGNDTLKGGGGNDDLFGGSDNDRLVGGAANDFLEGGSGNDSFVFGPGFGQDNITDFVAGAGTDDVIRFDKHVFKNFAAVLASSTQDGADVIITKGSNLVQLLNVQLAALHPDDFAFF